MDRTTHMGHEHIRHAHADAALSLAPCKSDPFESLRSKGFDEGFFFPFSRRRRGKHARIRQVMRLLLSWSNNLCAKPNDRVYIYVA